MVYSYMQSDQANYPYQAVSQQDMQTHACRMFASLNNQVMDMLVWGLL